MNTKQGLSSCAPEVEVSPRPRNIGCSYPERTGNVEAGRREARKELQL